MERSGSVASQKLGERARRVLGAWIKATAQGLGHTQEQLASACGLERNTVSRLYKGHVIKRRDYEIACVALGYEFDEALELATAALEHIVTDRAALITVTETKKEPLMNLTTHVITVCAEKGGVGKTTTVVTMAMMLAELGRRVLVVDLDPQANATAWLYGEYDHEDDGTSLLEALDKKRDLPILSTEHGIDLAASGRQMASAPDVLSRMTAGHLRIKKLLAPLRGAYDYILLDTPPTLGKITVSALTATDYALLPARTDGFSLDAMERTVDTCVEVQEDLNQGLEILGCVVVEYDQRAVVGRTLVKQLAEIEGLSVLEPKIATCTYFKEATVLREPITLYKPQHKATRQFRSLTRSIDDFCQEASA